MLAIQDSHDPAMMIYNIGFMPPRQQDWECERLPAFLVCFRTDFKHQARILYTKMNSVEFNALARDGDITLVRITHNRDSTMSVCAILVCDDEVEGLTAYNYLNDSKGQIVRFDYIGEAEKMVRSFGYKGLISVHGVGQKADKVDQSHRK